MAKRRFTSMRPALIQFRRVCQRSTFWAAAKTIVLKAAIRTSDAITVTFHVVFKSVSLVLAGAILVVLCKTIFSGHTVDLRAIEVPKALADAGFTSKVITWRIRDALDANRQRLVSSVLPTDILVLQDLPSVDIPEAGLSIDRAVALVRGLLPSIWRHDEIYGEFTNLGGRLSLELRLNEKLIFTASVPFSTSDGSGRDVGQLISDAALVLTVQRYSAAIRAHPAFAPLRIALGYVWQDHNQLDNATDNFAKAISLDPSRADGYVALGFLARYRGDWVVAKQRFSEALERDPRNMDASIGLAYALKATTGLDAAAEAFDKVLSLEPKHLDARIGLGGVYLDRNDPDRAAAQFEEAIQLYPGAADPYILLGYARIKQNRLSDATAAFHDAARLNSQSSEPHLGLASVLLEQKDSDSAVGEFREALRLSDNAFMLACNLLASKDAQGIEGVDVADVQRRLESIYGGKEHCSSRPAQ